jgi:hypothetical protein
VSSLAEIQSLVRMRVDPMHAHQEACNAVTIIHDGYMRGAVKHALLRYHPNIFSCQVPSPSAMARRC